MNLNHDSQPGKAIITMDENLGTESSAIFRSLVRDALSRSPKELILDCTTLSYIDSTGLGLLTLARSEASKIGCTVSMNNMSNGHTRKVLELVKFDQMFKMTFVEGK